MRNVLERIGFTKYFNLVIAINHKVLNMLTVNASFRLRLFIAMLDFYQCKIISLLAKMGIMNYT